MTPFEALRQIHPNAEPVTLILCEACTEALLAHLRQLFPPMQEGETCTLRGTTVMGCAFVDGPPDQCALHPFRPSRWHLAEESQSCPSK